MSDTPLWKDIAAQPDNLAAVVRHLYGPERERLSAAAEFVRNEKPIVFVAIGSAAYLSMVAECYLNRHRHFACVINASDALYTCFSALRNVNIIINSRSGETAEVVKLVQALRAEGLPFLALTNSPESTLARLATHLVWSASRADDLVSINIVSGMMLASLVLSAEILGQADSLLPLLRTLPDAFRSTLARATTSAEELAALFEGVQPIYLLYRDASKGAAHCGRLVLEEVARRPAVAMEAGEFRQGAIEVLDERFGAIVSVPPGELGALNLSLVRGIQRAGGRLLVLGEGGDLRTDSRTVPFPLPTMPLYLRPLLEIIPVQLLAYKLAERQGYSPGTVRHLSKVITSEVGIPQDNLGLG
jgi:glucosamine--fructose-6-phosphate aminotransferase (isomerizing)